VRRLSNSSITVQVRALVVSILVLVPVAAGLVLTQLLHQDHRTGLLSLVLGPAFDANNAAMIDMTEANAGWSQVVAGTSPTIRYRLKEDLVRAELDAVSRAVSSDLLEARDRTRFRALLREQEQAVDAWFTAAKRAEELQSESPSTSSIAQADAVRAFREYRDANRRLFTALRDERDLAREDARTSVSLSLVSVVSATLLVLALLIGWGALLRRSLLNPLERLRAVVERQRDGDREAKADAATGAAEVRQLAMGFNGLTVANQVLQERQASVLLSHQLALDVAQVVHSASGIDTAMYSVCAMLGEGLAADRVLLYTHDEHGRIVDRMQWHRYDLPDLPPLPPSLAQAVQDVNEELREATFFAVSDFLAPEVQGEERARRFYRATGAHSLLMVPVGVGERGLGVLAALMLEAPRRWRRHEIQSAQQCAGYVAQSIASLQLRQMQDEQVHQLTEIDRQKTDFLATVSHELRTPLTSIAGYLEMLEDGDYGDLSQPQLDALATIERNALRLRGMIEDLLVLNRIEASGLQPSLEEVPVGRLLGGVVEVLIPTAAMAEVDLQMAPVEPSLVVAVDPRHMERTFINLGSNAVKFTPAGGRVEMTAERDGEDVVVTVADTGIGIPEADLANLFQRFFRARNAADAAIPGTGLGLVIARTIVEGHGGRMTVQSHEGRGTTIQVWLPLVEPALEGNAEQPLTV
jgi:signal transduction histidine kinase